ncbi:MAG TPA: hypothetical protein VKB35_17525 [Ktedonobacteraceae bacterium]|nr:hypothetical protein [Ktedonobacteraceae bacterium]
MKNFAHEDPVHDTGVEIIDLDPSRNWFLIGQRLSSRARLWMALFTLLSLTILGVIVLSPLLVHSSGVPGKVAEIAVPLTSGNDLSVISENTPGIVCIKTSSTSLTISYWVANRQISTNNRVILELRQWVFDDKMTCSVSSIRNLHIIFFRSKSSVR